jgi:outer membrane autotransporter protein
LLNSDFRFEKIRKIVISENKNKELFYDFSVPKADNLIPYLGVGLGYSKIKNYMAWAIGDEQVTQKQNKVAGQLIAGARYQFTDNLAASLDYKYFRVLGKVKALDSSYYNHSVQVGLVVNI